LQQFLSSFDYFLSAFIRENPRLEFLSLLACATGEQNGWDSAKQD
jgi:hypothetical protein